MQPILLLAGLLVLSFVSIFVGVIRLTPADLLQLTPLQVQLLLISRLPRLLSIVISGSALAVAGTIMQQLARNRFVSPTTAGTMDSARLGVLISLLLFPGAGLLQRMAVSLVFALGGTFAFVAMLRRIQYKDVIFVPLVGLMLANIIGAGTTFIAYRFDLLQSLAVWMYGDFSMILAGRYELLYFERSPHAGGLRLRSKIYRCRHGQRFCPQPRAELPPGGEHRPHYRCHHFRHRRAHRRVAAVSRPHRSEHRQHFPGRRFAEKLAARSRCWVRSSC